MNFTPYQFHLMQCANRAQLTGFDGLARALVAMLKEDMRHE